MAELYEFDPAQDLQVLETFTFEEEIERPENVRFYTLDDQITDYFERRVPVGKVSRFQLRLLQKDADRVRDLYNDIVIGTETAYESRAARPRVGILPWITPVYTAAVQYKPFGWTSDYLPLLASRQPRYYDRLIAGLPRPYTFAEGRRATFPKAQRFVNAEGKEPIRALPSFVKTRGVLHAGGQYEVVEQPMPNTHDDIAMRGYWIDKRPLELLAPLEEHPILGTNEPHFYESMADYDEIVPSVEAILTHAVPVTPHPYRDAAPYLKVYDVRWSDIPWSAWKRHFPPAGPVMESPPTDQVSIPAHTSDIPGETLQKNYSIPFRPGMSPRYWLSIQQDGGALVQKLILTQASELAPITVPNPEPFVEPVLAAAKPEDCLPDTPSFEQLLTLGVYRPPGVCIPAEAIERERSNAGMKGKLQWGETTQSDILTQYLPILQAAQGPETGPLREPVIPKIEVPALSPLRNQVLAILSDTRREDGDKATDLRTLVSEMPVKGKIFLDNDEKFLLCEHSLALLAGDLGRDARTFYDTWCGIIAGSRVCKFCGEEINRDVFVSVTEFDDEGHAINHAEAPTVAEFHPGKVRTFTESLQSLRPLFDTRDPAQDAFFLLLSVLQILPEQAFLEPVLGQVRQLSAFTKSKGDSAQAIYGVCGIVLLMQIHEPFLIPRRSFGGPFFLTGFPRDGPADTPGILDSVLSALKNTFEQFRGSFTGPSLGLLKEIFRSTDKVRDKCVIALKVMTKPPASFIQKLGLTDYSDRLEQAAHRYATAPAVPAQLSVLVPNIKIDSTEPAKVSHAECLPEVGLSLWSTDTPPQYLQTPIVFSRRVLPGPTAERKTPSTSTRISWMELPKETVSRLAKPIPAFVKTLRNTPLAKMLGDRSVPWRQAAAVAGRLLDLARGIPAPLMRSLRQELEALDPRLNPSQLRDAARGISHAILDAVAKIPALREKWAEVLPKDLALKAMLRASAELEGDVRELVTAERETFKTRLGQKSDMERELIKQLLDIGLAPYIITLQDRQLFAKELVERVQPVDPLADPSVPEEGFQVVPTDADRDDADQGERGDFGDMPNRPYEGDDLYGTAEADIGV